MSTHSKPLQRLGLLSSLLLMLVGCGGNSGSGDQGSSTSRVHHITLQLTRSTQAPNAARNQGVASRQVRQVQPGEPGFIERLQLRLQQPQGVDLLPPQAFTLNATEQETVTREVALPDPIPAEFRVLVSAFNNFNGRQTEIFLGETLVHREDQEATIELLRNPDPSALVLIPATPSNLQQTVFTFLDGAAFGLAGTPMTLAVGIFEDNTGDFTLASGGFIASGEVTIGSCSFAFVDSAFPLGRGPQAGDHMLIDPCQVDAIDGRLMATNTALNATSTSGLAALDASTGRLMLPTSPPTLVTDEDTPGTVSVGVTLAGDRPGRLTFTISRRPARGTAAVDTTGLVTYRPAENFNGIDRLVVTAIATFSDGNSPSVLLGTVRVAITVGSLSDAIALLNPGEQMSPEGTAIVLSIGTRNVDGDLLSFSATGLPPGLSLNPTTGLISGTLTATASSGSPYPVSITVSDGTSSASAVFTWMVTPVGLPPHAVRIGSPSGPVTSGTTFTIPVQFNAETTNVVSYLVEFTFDPAVVLVTDVAQGSLLFEVPITNPAVFTSGVVRFAANNLTLAPATGPLTLANITFQVVGTAGQTSPLQLRLPATGVLVDSAFEAIEEVVFVDGAVQVN